MTDPSVPSFARGRRWLFGLNMLLTLGAVGALLIMSNYLAARHFARWDWTSGGRVELSPVTERLLHELTNDVRIVIYFEKSEPLYDSVWAMLKEYKFRSSRLAVETVDYVREPAAAVDVLTRYQLSGAEQRDMVIFHCAGRTRVVEARQLSDLDLSAITSGQGQEAKRTHFRGEMEFTSALRSVTNPRSLKAYFLEGHGEHRPDSDDGLTGYSGVAALLRENNVQHAMLSLGGAGEVPADCSLLIIAGPVNPFLREELEKIDRYLDQGGRVFALFNYTSLNRATGLESLLRAWGVAVGNTVVRESKDFTVTGNDLVVAAEGSHPIAKPFYKSRFYVLYPRVVSKVPGLTGADAPQVAPLLITSDRARVITDIRPGPVLRPQASDFEGSVPLAVAAEKGALPGVGATRGSMRMVVAGDSIFLANETIGKLGNRDFAGHVINWLLARNEVLGTLGPKPIKEYQLVMTAGQLSRLRWVLQGLLPAAILGLGVLVWLRRRR